MTDITKRPARRGRPITLTDQQRLDAARKAESQATAHRQAMEARVSEAQRAADARRNTLLGGALFAKATQDPKIAAVITELIAGLERAHDRAAFDGWTPPVPPAVTDPFPEPSGGNQQEGAAPDAEPGAVEPELPLAVTTIVRKPQATGRGTMHG